MNGKTTRYTMNIPEATILNLPHPVLWLIIGGSTKNMLVCQVFRDCFRKNYVVHNKWLSNNAIRWLTKHYQVSPKLYIRCCGLGLTDYVTRMFAFTGNSNANVKMQIKCLVEASESGRLDVVRFLLSKIEPKNLSHEKNTAIIAASEGGYLDVVRELSNYIYVNPTMNNNAAIIGACRAGYLRIAQFLDTQFLVNIADQNNRAFIDACRYGHTHIVRWLLSHTWVDPGAQFNAGFIMACKHNKYDVVDLLLNAAMHRSDIDPTAQNNTGLIAACYHNDPRIAFRLLENLFVDLENSAALLAATHTKNLELIAQLIRFGADPTIDNNAPIINACQHGDPGIVLFLLTLPGVDPGARNNAGLCTAITRNHKDVVRILLNHNLTLDLQRTRLLQSACSTGDFSLLQLLVSDPRLSITPDDTVLLPYACGSQNIRIMKYVLSIVPVGEGQWDDIFESACISGDVPMMRFLLNNPGVNPFYENNAGLIVASAEGNTEGIRLLLRLPGMNVKLQNSGNDALLYASQNRHFDVMRLLIQHGVNPIDSPEVFVNVCETGDYDMAVYLLQDFPTRESPLHKKNPGYGSHENEALIAACDGGHTRLVRLLLSRPGIDPNHEHNRAIYCATKQGHADILNILLERPDTNPGDNRNYIFLAALKTEKKSIIRRLLSDPRVDPGEDNGALSWAVANQKVDLVELLLQSGRVSVPKDLSYRSQPEVMLSYRSPQQSNTKAKKITQLLSKFR